MEIKTLEDQLQLIELAFNQARDHTKPIGIDGLPYLRQSNRWWDSEADQEKDVAQFTDVHSADDEPLAVAALLAHVKDRVAMSILSSTDSVLLRIIIQFETRREATANPAEVIKDRFLVELQWVMPLPRVEVSPLDHLPKYPGEKLIPTDFHDEPFPAANAADDELL